MGRNTTSAINRLLRESLVPLKRGVRNDVVWMLMRRSLVHNIAYGPLGVQIRVSLARLKMLNALYAFCGAIYKYVCYLPECLTIFDSAYT
jgi:hypothetical protein